MIKSFFNKILEIITSEDVPELTVFLLTFWTDIIRIIDSLIYLVGVIKTKNQFDKVIKEIDLHFEPFTETINRALANKSKIYPLVKIVLFLILTF